MSTTKATAYKHKCTPLIHNTAYISLARPILCFDIMLGSKGRGMNTLVTSIIGLIEKSNKLNPTNKNIHFEVNKIKSKNRHFKFVCNKTPAR